MRDCFGKINLKGRRMVTEIESIHNEQPITKVITKAAILKPSNIRDAQKMKKKRRRKA